MCRQRLSPVPVVTFRNRRYVHQQVWALIKALQCAGYCVSVRAIEQDAVSKTCLYCVTMANAREVVRGEASGSPFLAVKSAVDNIEEPPHAL